MIWRPLRPLDAYFLRPLGEFGPVWQFLAQHLAAQTEGKHVLDTAHGPAVVIWTCPADDGSASVSAIIGEAARRSPRRVRQAVRAWLDEHAAGCYAEPEGQSPAYERTLRFVGFTRVGDRWRWLS